MSYAIISLGGKQHRVREGEWLLVDRVPTEPGKTFNPTILMLGGDGNADFEAKGATVTAKVVEHVLGESFRDWIMPRERSGGMVGARPTGQGQARNGRPGDVQPSAT